MGMQNHKYNIYPSDFCGYTEIDPKQMRCWRMPIHALIWVLFNEIYLQYVLFPSNGHISFLLHLSQDNVALFIYKINM